MHIINQIIRSTTAAVVVAILLITIQFNRVHFRMSAVTAVVDVITAVSVKIVAHATVVVHLYVSVVTVVTLEAATPVIVETAMAVTVEAVLAVPLTF